MVLRTVPWLGELNSPHPALHSPAEASRLPLLETPHLDSSASPATNDDVGLSCDFTGKEEGWTTITHRSTPAKTTHRQDVLRESERKPLTERSFYFSNFPPACNQKDLWQIFSSFGSVSDVYIPNKLLNPNSCYGFVRFHKKSVTPNLIETLNGIWIGSFQLRVVVARSPGSTATQTAHQPLGGEPHPVGVPMLVQSQPPIIFEPDPSSVSWLNTCLIGISAPNQNLVRLTSILQEAGYEESSIVRMEGGELLLNLKSEEDQARLLVDQVTVNLMNLHSLRPWHMLNGLLARSVWLRVRGTPLHCWCTSFFTPVAERFVSLIRVDEAESKKTESPEFNVALLEGEMAGERDRQCCETGFEENRTEDRLHERATGIAAINGININACTVSAAENLKACSVKSGNVEIGDNSATSPAEEASNTDSDFSTYRNVLVIGLSNVGLGQQSVGLIKCDLMGCPTQIQNPDQHSPNSLGRFNTLSRKHGQFSALLAGS